MAGTAWLEARGLIGWKTALSVSTATGGTAADDGFGKMLENELRVWSPTCTVHTGATRGKTMHTVPTHDLLGLANRLTHRLNGIFYRTTWVN